MQESFSNMFDKFYYRGSFDIWMTTLISFISLDFSSFFVAQMQRYAISCKHYSFHIIVTLGCFFIFIFIFLASHFAFKQGIYHDERDLNWVIAVAKMKVYSTTDFVGCLNGIKENEFEKEEISDDFCMLRRMEMDCAITNISELFLFLFFVSSVMVFVFIFPVATQPTLFGNWRAQ